MDKPYAVGTFVWYENNYGGAGVGVIVQLSDPSEPWVGIDWVIPPSASATGRSWCFRSTHPSYDYAAAWDELSYAAPPAPPAPVEP
jgi:hypothetical protein